MSLSNRGGRRSSQRLKGFTLVELLVVLTLMGLVLGLVGPLSVDSFERIKSRDEVLELKHLLRLASADAFLSASWLTVTMERGDLAIHDLEGPRRTKRFIYLSFPNQELRFSPQGLPLGAGIQYLRRGRQETIELDPLLRPPQRALGSSDDD